MKLYFILAGIMLAITPLSLYPQVEYSDSSESGTFIAVVDIKYIFRKYSARKKAYKKLLKKKKAFLLIVEKRKKAIKDLEESFEDTKDKMDQAQFRKALAEIELAKENLNILIDKQNRTLLKLEKKLKRPIIKKIIKTINIIREEYGYDIILNKSDVLSYDSSVDLTQEVLDSLEDRDKRN